VDAVTGVVERSLTGHSRVVSSVAWNVDGTMLATGSWDKTVRIWSLSSAGTFECQSTLKVDSIVLSISYSPFGDTLAVGCDNGKILLVDAVTVVVKQSLNGHT
jgi:WD40 repeat protein